MRRNRGIIYTISVITYLFLSVSVNAQTSGVHDEMSRGDRLRQQYRFREASDVYLAASQMIADTLVTAEDSLLKLDLSDRILMAENGISMMDFVYVPTVVAKHRFSIEDFFLYYPLEDGSWRKTPSQLDSMDHQYSKAAFIPDGEDVIYWSASDKDGIRNIFHTEYQDTVWSVPALLNEQMTSASDEIYPMLSPDGNQMFFSSAGLYGVGGYDIYVSDWDPETGDWSVPVNMGFPYSSPADDFLFINTDDGKYSIFASNRDCSKDSVWVYVLEYDDMPVRRAVTDPDELAAVARLDLMSSTDDEPSDPQTDIPENIDTRRYMDKMSEVRVLRDSIDRFGISFEDEGVLIALQDSLARASALLQEIEMEFLFNGVVIDPDKLLVEADREIAAQTEDFVFARKNFGGPLSLNILEPEPEFDYSFKILEEGQFAEDNTLPAGLVYQIQMFTTSTQVTVAKLKGLSPVFETKTPTGKYTYRVGVFRNYADVLANLNSVKKLGFRTAFIVAFNDGKEIKVAKARTIEAERKPAFYEVRISTGSGELDQSVASGIRQQASGKDMARVDNADGTKTYVIGPFADKAQAESLAEFSRAMGAGSVVCVEIPQK